MRQILGLTRVGFTLISIVLTSENVVSQKIEDINHVIHIGQSLGAGEHSLPIVTDSITGYGNVSFKIGTHTWARKHFEGTPELRDSSNFVFVPLIAHERGHEGETIANGLCDHLKSTSKVYLNKDFKFLFSFSGQGGRLIRELDKIHDDAKDPRAGDRQSGGGYYKTAIDDVKRAKATSNSSGLSYSVFAITWMQGESNRTGFINRWENPIKERNQFLNLYINDLIQVKNDLQKDIIDVTKQDSTVPFFIYQTAGASIGTAQLMACDREKDMYMVGPTYMMPNGENGRIWNSQEHGSAIHLTADGERWLGEMFAKVMRKVVFEKEKWEPLRPIYAWSTKNKKHIRIKFHVPISPLVLDSIFLPKQGIGFGFDIYDSIKNHKIKNVSVVDKEIVDFELTDKINVGIKNYVKYGLNSYVREVSKKIFNISKVDTIIHEVAHLQIEFDGNIIREFLPLATEGVFTMANRSKLQSESTSILVRKVYLNERGNTVLLAERDDLTNNVPFKVGQSCYLLRGFEFGNLRDSDPEQSTFSFKDRAYGNRYGQKYPLYNWSIAFQDLVIEKFSVMKRKTKLSKKRMNKNK